MGLARGEVDWERLVARCRAGDQRAWEQIVRATSPMLYGIARRKGLSEDDAADCVQAAYVALYRSLGSLEAPGGLRGWLATTAAREAVRVSRIRRSRETADISTLEDTLAADEAEADELAAQAERGASLAAALAELGGRCRELLTRLYAGAGESYQAISEALGMPVGSIGPTRARCLAKLRAILERSGFFRDEAYQAEVGPPL